MVIEYVLPMLLSITAPQIATTESGEKVYLYENGTWRKFKTDETVTTITAPDQNAAPEDSESTTENRITLIDIIKNTGGNDFRTVRWGMSVSEVKKQETAKLLSESGGQLEYEAEFLGYICKVLYYFTSSKLQRAELLISQEHTDPAKYYKDYENLIKFLNPLYGTPISDQKDWKNEMYKNDRSRYGFAISIGFLTCKTVWSNKRSQVSLNISGGNHKIKTNLEYIGVP
jgi:hypothetical protein